MALLTCAKLHKCAVAAAIQTQKRSEAGSPSCRPTGPYCKYRFKRLSLECQNCGSGNENQPSNRRRTKNLLNDLPSSLPDELVTVLAENLHVRIERIVSTGHSSPDDCWYDQDEHEWVVVLKGEGKLIFEDDAEPIHMKPGDHINIPAQRRHRIEWTTPNEPTVWLAVFYQGDESEFTAKESKP